MRRETLNEEWLSSNTMDVCTCDEGKITQRSDDFCVVGLLERSHETAIVLLVPVYSLSPQSKCN